MLRVYELKGSGRPRDLPAEGLEGIWPEPPFYYLFYRKESAEPILEWLRSRPDWLLTARYDLPYDKWQDISVPQISLGSFNIRLSADPAAALIQGAAPPPSSAAAERISTLSLTCPRPEAGGRVMAHTASGQLCPLRQNLFCAGYNCRISRMPCQLDRDRSRSGSLRSRPRVLLLFL